MYIKGKLGSGKDKPEKIRLALFRASARRRTFSSPHGYFYERYCKNGIPVETLSKGSDPDSAVLIVHGGGLYSQITDFYRKQLKFFVGKTNALAVMVDYGVLPTAKYPSQLNDVYSVYADLVEKYHGNVVIASDGVGANLAVAACLKAKGEGCALPKGLICIQPFLDLTLSGDSVYDHFYFDKLFGNFTIILPDLKCQLLEDKFFEHIGGVDKTHPLVSPIFGEFSDFPKTYVVTGDYSIFESDALTFVKKLKEAGVEVTFDDYHKKYGLYPLDSKGADKKKIFDFITRILGEASDLKREKRKKAKSKRIKYSLNVEPIEPQDESVLIDDDGDDVIFVEGDPDSFESVFGKDE